MKIRFFIYSSLLFVALALPCIYQYMNKNIQEQEVAIRIRKENWLFDMAITELNFSRFIYYNDPIKFWYHKNRGLDYAILWCEMKEEDIKNIKL